MSMKREVVVLVADDDAGHVRLIEKNLRRAALGNRIERFEDGQQVLDFLFCRGNRKRERVRPGCGSTRETTRIRRRGAEHDPFGWVVRAPLTERAGFGA